MYVNPNPAFLAPEFPEESLSPTGFRREDELFSARRCLRFSECIRRGPFCVKSKKTSIRRTSSTLSDVRSVPDRFPGNCAYGKGSGLAGRTPIPRLQSGKRTSRRMSVSRVIQSLEGETEKRENRFHTNLFLLHGPAGPSCGTQVSDQNVY